MPGSVQFAGTEGEIVVAHGRLPSPAPLALHKKPITLFCLQCLLLLAMFVIAYNVCYCLQCVLLFTMFVIVCNSFYLQRKPVSQTFLIRRSKM